MTGDLVPVEATIVDRAADDRHWLRQIAEAHAVQWLHGYTNEKTRNSYAVDIGLSPEVRAGLPGGPNDPKPPAVWAWIPWALDNGIDPAGQVTRQQVESYAHVLHDQPKTSRQRRWGALCAFYRHLRAEGVVFANPNEMVNRRTMGLSGTDPSSTVPLHPEQVQALYLAASMPHRSRTRNRAMLAVLAATGCRAAELVGILLDDYQPQIGGHALVRIHGKGGKQRWVMLPAPDAELVTDYIAVRVASRAGSTVTVAGQVSAARPVPQPLFTTSKGRAMHVNSVTRMLRTVARQPAGTDAARLLAPIAGTLHPHQLRHTYAVVAENAGVPLSRIQADLGHASLATTQTYLHAADGAEHSAARVVSGIYHAGSK